MQRVNLTLPGTYALVLFNSSAATLHIGALGTVDFSRGYYVYIGSAFGSGGLKGRLRHHAAPVKHPRWHVDYLRPQMTLTGVWCLLSEQKKEHYWARLWSDFPGATIPCTGFGTSDCTCKAHLFHFNIISPKNELKQFLQGGENLMFLLPSVLVRILN